MEVARIKMAFAKVIFYARILWRGFCRTICGTMIALLIAMAICGFVSITSKTGWAAVWRFVVACVLLTEGFVNMHFIGRKKNGAGNRERRK